MSVKERARLLMEFIAARKKLFAAKRAEEQRNKPPTKAKQRKKLCIYMNHMARYKDKDLKGKIFDAIKQMFDKAYKQVNDFVPIDTESSRKKPVSKKRAGERPSKASAKRQKIEDDAEKAKLKACLEIVPGDDSAINIESLATKYPIVDWKTHILAEDKMYYQIISPDGKKKYPLIQEMLSRMLSRRLEVDHKCEMAFEILKFIKAQYKKKKNVWIHPPELQLLVGVTAAAQD
ncbi:hypothetical protein Tco_0611321 [Tanacetum coccineum]